MGELQYSIFRYAPSIVSGEKINLAAAFYYPETGYRELFSISRWNRISAFDDTLNISLLKALMADIKDEMGTELDNPHFDLRKFCLQYDSELYFDKCESLVDVSLDALPAQIEEVKRMYFQFEYDLAERPVHEDQKKFLRRLLTSKKVEYTRQPVRTANFGAEIKYDYIFDHYGVIFFDFNVSKIDHKVMNKVKAWVWNALNATQRIDLVVLYNLENENRPEVKPALEMLKEVAYKMINIHDGFSEVSALIEKEVS